MVWGECPAGTFWACPISSSFFAHLTKATTKILQHNEHKASQHEAHNLARGGRISVVGFVQYGDIGLCESAVLQTSGVKHQGEGVTLYFSDTRGGGMTDVASAPVIPLRPSSSTTISGIRSELIPSNDSATARWIVLFHWTLISLVDKDRIRHPKYNNIYQITYREPCDFKHHLVVLKAPWPVQLNNFF